MEEHGGLLSLGSHSTAPEEGKKTRKQVPTGPSVISPLENQKTRRWINPRTSRSQALVRLVRPTEKLEASRGQLPPCIDQNCALRGSDLCRVTAALNKVQHLFPGSQQRKRIEKKTH